MGVKVFIWAAVISVALHQVSAIQCPEVAVNAASVTFSDPVRETDGKVTVTCSSGYVIAIGQNNVTSLCADGAWDTVFPSACQVIDCGDPPEPRGAEITLEAPALGPRAYGQVATYTCHSGHVYWPTYRVDSAETVKVKCNLFGQWEITQGYTNITELQFSCSGYANYQGCRYVNDTLDVSLVETAPSTGGNKDACFTLCRDNDKIFAARQGDKCFCLDTIAYEKYPDAECNKRCHDNQSFCGDDGALYSVWNTLFPCVEIDGSLLLADRKMYSAETCQQFCRGTDARLAFWRKKLKSCVCLDSIPAYVAREVSLCQTPVDTIPGDLYITETFQDFRVNSCDDIFNQGVFYHGSYYTGNGSKIYCNFKDNNTVCPEGWLSYDGNCYLFENHLMDMDGHFNNCLVQDSQLVSVGDAEEWTFLWDVLSVMKIQETSKFYIGLYDIQLTFSYMWTDETAVTFRKFARDYPSGITNRCVVFESGYMKNIDCTSFVGAICEKSKSAVGCARANPSRFEYKKSYPKMSIPFCFETCRASNFIYSATRGTYCYCSSEPDVFETVEWQLCDLPCTRHKYQICGGNSSDLFYVTSDSGQPKRDGCLPMILGSLLANVSIQSANGSLEVVDCLEVAGVVCPESWVEINGRCYRFFPESLQDPASMCVSIGGHLAVYETEDEAHGVLHLINSTFMLSAVSNWLFGLLNHRMESSNPRYINGAFVNDSLRVELDWKNTSQTQCYAQSTRDFSSIIGADCAKTPYICEKGPDYLGCNEDVDPKLEQIEDYVDLTLTQCLETCKGQGKILAGVKYPAACYCSDNVTLTRVSESLCPKTCSFHQACGSLTDFMNIYILNYHRNATSCEELFNQGVLLSGLYSLGAGVNTWCGMKDSAYLAQQIEIWHHNQSSEVDFSDLTWNRVGVGDLVLGLDVVASSTTSTLTQRCNGLFQPASIVATIRSAEAQKLVQDVLRWSLDTPNSIPAFVGLVDQFYMGAYTWSDGSLFRLSDVSWTQVPGEIYFNQSKATTVEFTVDGKFQGQNTSAVNHAVCQRDASYLGCLLTTGDVPPEEFTVRGYLSMSLTLCHQICQGQLKPQFLVSLYDCICFDPKNLTQQVMNFLAKSTDPQCDVPCPGNSLQKCAGSNYFRHHVINPDFPLSCRELYDNFVLIPSSYLINGSQQHCGIDDKSTTCPAGFIGKEGKCYRFYRQNDKTASEAALICQSQGSYLASPISQADLNNLINIIQLFSSLKTASLWLVGYYSPFGNGRFVTAAGDLIPDTDPLVADLKTGIVIVALNITSGRLVTLPYNTQLPFICQTSQELIGCAKVNSLTAYSTLTLSAGMSIQQCVAFCLGNSNQSQQIFALLQDSQCACVDGQKTILNATQNSCNKPCTGHFMQLCGSAADNAFSVYPVANYKSANLNHSCDSLLSYGVVQPATYFVNTSEYVVCFKYSRKSDLFMTNIASTDVQTSTNGLLSSSGLALMRLKKLLYQGWTDTQVSNVFFLFKLPDYYVIEGIIIKGNILNLSLTTSMDGLFYEIYRANVSQLDNNLPVPHWITLSVPVVAKWIKISLEAWNGTNPVGSSELVGYPYTSHNFTYHYRGCHENLIITKQSASTSSSYEDCRKECRSNGYPYFILQQQNTDICQCSYTETTRDFYANDTDKCGGSCFEGYPCSTNGWNNALYTTADLTCPKVVIANSTMTTFNIVNSSSDDAFPVMTRLSFTCNVGHEINASMTTISSTCYNFQQWIPSLAGLSCTRVSCGPFPTLPDAKITSAINSTTLYGDTISYECMQSKFTFNGTVAIWTMTCNEFKKWLPAPLPCEPVKCLAAPKVANAVVNGTASFYTYGTVLTYTCQDGCHFPSDNQTVKSIYCQGSGQWSTIEPACERFRCSAEPPALPFTSVLPTNESYSAIYHCEEGTEFSDQLMEKLTICSNITYQWSDIRDSCQYRTYHEGDIWLEQANSYIQGTPLMGLGSRSLIDCTLKCINAQYCRMLNYNKEVPQDDIGCRLYSENINNVTSESHDSWDIYVVQKLWRI